MLNKFAQLFVLALLFGCSIEEQDHSMIGVYETRIPTKLELLKHSALGYDAYAGGVYLELFSDSTFYLSTCGHIVEGNWRSQDKSIILSATDIENRISKNESKKISLDSVPVYKEPLFFEKHGGKLVNTNYNRMMKLFKKSN